MKKQLFIFKYILFCCYFASFSCKTSNDLPNIYVGEYFDENYRYTLPVIIAFMGSDTVQVAKILNEGIKVNIYMLNHDSLIGKEKYKYHFGGNESLTLTDEKHHFYFKKNSSFHQKEIHLSGKAYEFNINDPNNDLSIIESWHFKDDSLMINRDYYYLNELCHAEVEVERYNILNYDNKCRFLVFKGEKSPEIFWQIIPSKEDDIFLFNYNSGNAILGKSSSIHTRNAKKFSVSEKQHLYQYYQFKNKPTPINGYNDLKRNMVKNCSSTHIDGPDGYIVV